MKEKVLSYLVTIIVFLMGAAAAWIVMHLANAKTVSSVQGNEAKYSQLQQSILNQ